MGIWRLLARLIKLSDTDTLLVTDDRGGRLIYEQYDSNIGKPSEKSKFYEVHYAKLHPRSAKDGEEVQGLVELNLSDAEMAEEMTE